MKKYIFEFLVIFSLTACLSFESFSQNPVVIDFGTQHQQIDGFGASTAWHGQISKTEADAAFGNEENQLGLSILRIRIDPAGQNNWGDELENSKKATERGAIVLASPWTPPASLKSNNNTIGGELLTSQYGIYAAFLNNFVNYMYDNGVTISAISIQNEPNIEVKYESCTWSPTQLLNFCKDYTSSIMADIVAPEAYNFDLNYSDPILNDPNTVSNVAIIGEHLYGTFPLKYENALSKGKRVWMTEHYYNPDDIATCMTMAKEILDCMNDDMSAYIWWYLRQPGCNLITSQGNIQKKGYIMAQFSKFIRPGYHRVEATFNPQPNVFACSFAGAGTEKVIVALNRAPLAKNQQFDLQNSPVSKFIKYSTSETKSLSNEGTIDVSGGSFSTTLDARSITTFVSTESLSYESLYKKSNIDIKFHPNLAETGTFSLTVDGWENKSQLNMKIINLDGRIIHEQPIMFQKNNICLNLKSGIYLLRLTDGSSTISKKFIVK